MVTTRKHPARSRARALTLAALALGFLWASPRAAHAACGAPVDQVAAIQQADSVFIGRVIELSDISRLATMEVLEVWKGPDLESVVVVNGSFSGREQLGPNDRLYTLGGTYLVVPFGSSSPFFDEACSATSLHSPTGGIIPPQFQEATGSSTARAPISGAPVAGTRGGGGVDWTLVGGVAVGAAILLTALLGGRRTRRARRLERPEPVPQARPTEKAPVAAKKVAASSVATADVDAVAGRKKRKKRPRKPVKQASESRKFQRSGLDNLAVVRKKTRRIKKKRLRKRGLKIRS